MQPYYFLLITTTKIYTSRFNYLKISSDLSLPLIKIYFSFRISRNSKRNYTCYIYFSIKKIIRDIPLFKPIVLTSVQSVYINLIHEKIFFILSNAIKNEISIVSFHFLFRKCKSGVRLHTDSE